MLLSSRQPTSLHQINDMIYVKAFYAATSCHDAYQSHLPFLKAFYVMQLWTTYHNNWSNKDKSTTWPAPESNTSSKKSNSPTNSYRRLTTTLKWMIAAGTHGWFVENERDWTIYEASPEGVFAVNSETKTTARTSTTYWDLSFPLLLTFMICNAVKLQDDCVIRFVHATNRKTPLNNNHPSQTTTMKTNTAMFSRAPSKLDCDWVIRHVLILRTALKTILTTNWIPPHNIADYVCFLRLK